jgi:pyridoxine 5-phosphate synthase
LETAIPKLKEAGIQVSLFIEPQPEQVEASIELGVDSVELHTGRYATAHQGRERADAVEALAAAAEMAHSGGVEVHAGHGLDYHNYPIFAAAVPHVEEVSIGFAIIARALIDGLDGAVREMVRLVKQ